ncbi:MAG: transposase [Desulfobaccales bacterium]
MDERPRRFSARLKVEIVLRLLRGEDLELLSRQLNVTAAQLSNWREQFLTAGRTVLKKRPQDARDLGYGGPPFPWDEARRLLIRSELDAAFFHLYGLSREEADYVMETFPLVRRHDEEAYGEFRTKRLILEIYDELQQARQRGRAYQSRLDPPPGEPRRCPPAARVKGSLSP